MTLVVLALCTCVQESARTSFDRFGARDRNRGRNMGRARAGATVAAGTGAGADSPPMAPEGGERFDTQQCPWSVGQGGRAGNRSAYEPNTVGQCQSMTPFTSNLQLPVPLEWSRSSARAPPTSSRSQ